MPYSRTSSGDGSRPRPSCSHAASGAARRRTRLPVASRKRCITCPGETNCACSSCSSSAVAPHPAPARAAATRTAARSAAASERAEALIGRDVDVLHLRVALERVHAELAPEARLLEAAERGRHAHGRIRVDRLAAVLVDRVDRPPRRESRPRGGDGRVGLLAAGLVELGDRLLGGGVTNCEHVAPYGSGGPPPRAPPTGGRPPPPPG